MDTATNITINVVEPGSNLPVPSTGLFTQGIGGPEVAIISTALIVLVLTTFALLRYKRKYNKTSIKSLGILAFMVSLATFTSFIINTKAIDLGTNNDNSDSNLTVTAEDANLTIEVGDEPVFVVLPVQVTVAEATEAGYTLTASTQATNLVSTTESSNIIPMVVTDEGELVALKDNTWGLALDNEPTAKEDKVYKALSTDQDNPTILKTIDDYSETPANDTTTIYYAFYITPDTPYGIYTSSDINYKANKNQANVANVIYHGNGLYFNNNPAQTTNNVDYTVGITDKTAKYSHTPNINDEGEASGVVGYLGKEINEVISIPNASKLRIKLSYGGGYLSIYGGYPAGFLSFWQGTHPDYTTSNNADSTIKTCGTSDVTDGKFYGDRNNQDTIITTECEIEGNSATFAYWITGGGPGSSGPIYGYHASVTGYDADGNIIYLSGNTQVSGEYQDPAQDLPYIFLGWNEDKDATVATYKSKNDIEQDLPLIPHQTTELYAIWQKATKITFDGNGSTSGEMPDKLLAAGEGTSLCSNYTRTGYTFNNWNTEPDGSGDTYSQCQSYTASTDQSVELTLYAQWIGNVLDTGQTVSAKLKRLAGNSSASYNTEDTNVTTITRASELPADFTPTDDNTISINGSTTPVYAWYDTDTTTIYYYTELEKVIMNPDSSYMFYNFKNLSDATSIADWDTSNVTNMNYMFYNAGYNATTWSIGDLSSWDTSKVTNMGGMFHSAGYNATTFSLDLSSWDTLNVTNMNYMFYNAGYNATTWSVGDLSSWDTSKVTSMISMFFGAGSNATTFSLDLSSWDTSKVTDMSSMFSGVGYKATTWSIGDLSSWDTSKVTNMSLMLALAGSNATTWSVGDLSSWDTSNVTSMSQMFYSAGYNATTFSLDLSSWDTSKVTDMSSMFPNAGYNATTWSIGDLSSWDTSEVTNMSSMFYYAGYNATTWSIGDLSSWDTSKVTDMQWMFEGAGKIATTWSIGDLSSWDTSKVTDMSLMFSEAGYNATTWSIGDLSSWDTSKVTNMGGMFRYAGCNATTFSLDLSSWDTSKVTNMSNMFSNAGYNATTWSITIPQKTGDIDNTTSAFYGQDSSIYASPPNNRFFTLAAQVSSNTTNTTGGLNSVNNAEAPIQDDSPENRSAYATENTEDTENTENIDDTDSDTTSTPSRQEPLGEYQSSITTSPEDTNIVIPILIATSITLGTSALALLVYKSRQREDE